MSGISKKEFEKHERNNIAMGIGIIIAMAIFISIITIIPLQGSTWECIEYEQNGWEYIYYPDYTVQKIIGFECRSYIDMCTTEFIGINKANTNNVGGGGGRYESYGRYETYFCYQLREPKFVIDTICDLGRIPKMECTKETLTREVKNK